MNNFDEFINIDSNKKKYIKIYIIFSDFAQQSIGSNALLLESN